MKRFGSIKKLTAAVLLIAMVFALISHGPERSASASQTGYVTAQTGLRIRKAPGTEGVGCEPLVYKSGEKKGQEILLDHMQEVKVLDTVKTAAGEEWYYISVKLYGQTYKGYSLALYISTTITPTPTPEITEAPTPEPEPTQEPKPTEEPTPEPTPEPTKEPTPEPTKEPEPTQAPGGKTKQVSKFPGKVTATVLTLRKGAGTGKQQITTLSKGTEVTVTGSKIIKVDGKNQRWYKVKTKIDGKNKSGYVLSDYVTLSLTNKTTAKSRVKKLTVYKAADTKSGKLKNAKGKAIKPGKAKVLTILEEITTETVKQVNGVNVTAREKWFKVRFKYNGKKKTGYVKAINVNLVATSQAVTADPTPTPEPTPDPTLDPPTEEPAPVEHDDSIEGANAYIAEDVASAYVKTEPSYNSSTLFLPDLSGPVTLYPEQAIVILDTVETDKMNWVHIRFMNGGNEYTGYVPSYYIENASELGLTSSGTAAALPDGQIEEKLEKEGFPESYRQALRELHALYPKWEFKAYHTGLDWNTVIEEECKVGRNLIPNSKSVEWKSLADHAYNWKTDTFIPYDGSTWVSASKEAIEYYMDPRNFLKENLIFQFEVLTYNPSHQTKEGVENVLKNTALADTSYEFTDEFGKTRTISYADTFMAAALYSGVSPYHLASRVKQEVTIGKVALSNSVSGTVEGLEGLYNFYNIGANDSTVPGGNIANGLRFAKNGPSSSFLKQNCLIPWDNRYKSILGGSFYIGYNYINRGQDTIYLQKFNVTPENRYIHQYMTNVEAPYSEGMKVYNAYEEPGNTAIVFSIPVYDNMPEKACPVPEKAYNPNNWLKSLTASLSDGTELALTPSFDMTKDQEYDLIVSADTEVLHVSAKAVSKLATVAEETDYPLEPGTNKLKVKVTAENGDVRKYIINVVREVSEPAPEPTAEPEP